MSDTDPQAPLTRALANGPSRALDAITVLRQHPDWFFRSGQFDVEEMIGLIVAEASRGGAKQLTVMHEGRWVSIESDTDWLRGDVAAFFAPVQYPEGGRNSARTEALLTAFCCAVITVTPEGPYEVVSSPEAVSQFIPMPTERLERGRLVAFLPPPSTKSADADDAPREGRPARPGLRLVQGEGEKSIAAAVEHFDPDLLDG